MCEYQYIKDKGSGKHRFSPPICSVTGGYCTLCVLANRDAYNKAKAKEAEEAQNRRNSI